MFFAEWLGFLWESFHDKAVSSLRTPVDKIGNNIRELLTEDCKERRKNEVCWSRESRSDYLQQKICLEISVQFLLICDIKQNL